ncbi:MAG: hypothetical protein WAN20_18620 [Pseudonocardiaceae bacterium]
MGIGRVGKLALKRTAVRRQVEEYKKTTFWIIGGSVVVGNLPARGALGRSRKVVQRLVREGSVTGHQPAE